MVWIDGLEVFSGSSGIIGNSVLLFVLIFWDPFLFLLINDQENCLYQKTLEIRNQILVKRISMSEIYHEGGESRDVLIKHLKMELDELRVSSRKFNELYEVLVSLENSYKILKEEKKRSEDDQKSRTADQLERISTATNELRIKKNEFQGINGEAIDLRNRLERLRSDVEHKEHQETVMNEKIAELGRNLSSASDLREQLKQGSDDLKRDTSNLRNTS